MEKIETTFEPTNTGYCAYANHYPVYTTGKDLPELVANLFEAINLYFDGEGRIIEKSDIVFIQEMV